jgi:hypothetical protein
VRSRLILLIALVTLLSLDVVTTTLALSLGFMEANPIMRTIVAVPVLHITLKLAFANFVFSLAGLTDRVHPAGGDCVVCSAVAFYCLPVVSNLYQMTSII